MSITATKYSHCDAKCGRLIEPDQKMEPISIGEGKWHGVHVGCLDAYKRLVANDQAPTSGSHRYARRTVELVEHECQRCGAAYAGRPEDVVDRCRYPTVGGGVCGGPLVDVDAAERTDEIHVLSCADCGERMRVRGRPYPAGEVPTWLERLYARYRPVCGNCSGEVTPGLGAASGLGSGSGGSAGATSPPPAGSGAPARSRSGGPLRRLDPQLGLGGGEDGGGRDLGSGARRAAS